jgi:hypothetical protein
LPASGYFDGLIAFVGCQKNPGIQTIIVVNAVVAAGGYHPLLLLPGVTGQSMLIPITSVQADAQVKPGHGNIQPSA